MNKVEKSSRKSNLPFIFYEIVILARKSNLETLHIKYEFYFSFAIELLALSRHHSSFSLFSRSKNETFFGFSHTNC